MKAHEARELAQKQLDSILTKSLEEIYIKINTEVEKGHFECKYYKAILPAVVEMLKEDGYTVTNYYNQIEGHTYTIKW